MGTYPLRYRNELAAKPDRIVAGAVSGAAVAAPQQLLHEKVRLAGHFPAIHTLKGKREPTVMQAGKEIICASEEYCRLTGSPAYGPTCGLPPCCYPHLRAFITLAPHHPDTDAFPGYRPRRFSFRNDRTRNSTNSFYYPIGPLYVILRHLLI